MRSRHRVDGFLLFVFRCTKLASIAGRRRMHVGRVQKSISTSNPAKRPDWVNILSLGTRSSFSAHSSTCT